MSRPGIPRWLPALLVLLIFGCGNDQQPSTSSQSPPPAAVSLASPARLAMTATDQLLVADASRKGVATVDRTSGTPTSWVMVDGVPLAVAELDGDILVGEETGALLRYRTDGQALGAFGSASFTSVNDLEVDPDAGQIFVLDARANEVRVLDLQGDPVTSFGAAELTHPAGLALDPLSQRVFVSELGSFSSFGGFHPRVRIYNYQGTVLGSLGSGLSRPQGLAFANGKLYVVDSLYGMVQCYDATSNTLLTTFGNHGSAAGELMLPLDVVADPSAGLLYVSNNRNTRIETFDIGGAP